MGLFKQIGNWFKGKSMKAEKTLTEANVETNSAIAIEEANANIRKYRDTIRDVLAQNKTVEKDIAAKEAEIEKFGRMANRALDGCDEVAATQCLESQTRAETELTALQKQFEQNKIVISNARTQLSKMEAQVETAERDRIRLLTQRKGAQLRKQMAEANSKLAGEDNPLAGLNVLAEQVAKEEAVADATEELVYSESGNVAASLEEKYGDRIQNTVADKLAALKAKRSVAYNEPMATSPVE